MRLKSALSGSRGASSGAATATKTMKAPTRPPAAARVFRRAKRDSSVKIEERAGFPGALGTLAGVGAMSGPPLKSNSRVEPRVAQIDQHVDDDEDRRVEQHQVLDDDDVALDHGGDERASEPGHPERLLDRHRSA